LTDAPAPLPLNPAASSAGRPASRPRSRRAALPARPSSPRPPRPSPSRRAPSPHTATRSCPCCSRWWPATTWTASITV